MILEIKNRIYTCPTKILGTDLVTNLSYTHSRRL
jgi:hypothetical protein